MAFQSIFFTVKLRSGKDSAAPDDACQFLDVYKRQAMKRSRRSMTVSEPSRWRQITAIHAIPCLDCPMPIGQKMTMCLLMRNKTARLLCLGRLALPL